MVGRWVWSVALSGIDGCPVEVEAAKGGGLPRVQLVGLPDASLSEAKARVRAAVLAIENASAEIAAGTNDLSMRTEQSASNLQQTASSMAPLTDSARSAADHAPGPATGRPAIDVITSPRRRPATSSAMARGWSPQGARSVWMSRGTGSV